MSQRTDCVWDLMCKVDKKMNKNYNVKRTGANTETTSEKKDRDTIEVSGTRDVLRDTDRDGGTTRDGGSTWQRTNSNEGCKDLDTKINSLHITVIT